MSITLKAPLLLFFALSFFTAQASNTDVNSLLSNIKPGQKVDLPAGAFLINSGISIFADNIEIQGKGKHKTTLVFSNNTNAAQGMLIVGKDLTMKGFSIKNAPGDGLVVKNSIDVVIDDVGVFWDNEKAGGYGIYPVKSKQVQIKNSFASDATEAGIYLGQSESSSINGNLVRNNTAGIEIENSSDIDVYNNQAEKNAIGIVVTGVPYLPKKETRSINIFDNKISANNNTNKHTGGSYIKDIFSGIGITVTASQDVRIHNNHISDQSFSSIVIGSYYLFSQRRHRDPFFNPWSKGISIYSNILSVGDQKRSFTLPLPSGQNTTPPYPLIWDGIPKGKDMLEATKKMELCSDEKIYFLTKTGVEAIDNPIACNKKIRSGHETHKKAR